MGKDAAYTGTGTLTTPPRGSILTSTLENLPKNASAHYGRITEAYVHGPQDTVLKILDDREHEYSFTGQEAFYASKCQHGRVQKFQNVHFFTTEESKEVSALLMKTNNGFELLRSDKDFR